MFVKITCPLTLCLTCDIHIQMNLLHFVILFLESNHLVDIDVNNGSKEFHKRKRKRSDSNKRLKEKRGKLTETDR